MANQRDEDTENLVVLKSQRDQLELIRTELSSENETLERKIKQVGVQSTTQGKGKQPYFELGK